MKTCPMCIRDIDERARRCPECRHDFTEAEMERGFEIARRRRRNKYLVFLFLVAAAIVWLEKGGAERLGEAMGRIEAG